MLATDMTSAFLNTDLSLVWTLSIGDIWRNGFQTRLEQMGNEEKFESMDAEPGDISHCTTLKEIWQDGYSSACDLEEEGE